MALLCLVHSQAGCYSADRVRCKRSSPDDQTIDLDWGVFYEDDASVLCGNWLCGGPLDIPAASFANSRPSQSVSVAGPSLEQFLYRLGRAPRCASISSAHAHSFPTHPRSNCYQGLPTTPGFFLLSIQWAQGLLSPWLSCCGLDKCDSC